MMILALLALLITNGSAVGETVETIVVGFAGQNVLLPCDCSSVRKLVWQKGETLVSAYPQYKSSPIDQDYVNRIEHFLEKEKTNCSIMILNISSADAGVYTCHALVNVTDKVWTKRSLNVNLTVSEKNDIPKNENFTGDNSAVSISVPILVVLMLAVAVLLALLMKRRHGAKPDTDSPAQQPMIQSV